MLIELDQSTMANMTAALEYVCKRIPRDKDSHQARKRIADAMADSAKAGNRSYVDFQNVGFEVLDEILYPPGSWQLWFKTIGTSMNRLGGRTIISMLLILVLALIWRVLGNR